MTINTAEIEARLAKATEGPWRLMEGIKTLWIDAPEAGISICDLDVVRPVFDRSVASVNGEFIAHAPTDIRDLLSALKAETARAEAMERMWEIVLDEAREANDALSTRLHQETNMLTALGNAFEIERARTDRLTAQLTAANEKLAAHAKAEKDAADLYDWVMSVCENPPEPTPALRAVWEKYKDLPAFNTGDGNGR